MRIFPDLLMYFYHLEYYPKHMSLFMEQSVSYEMSLYRQEWF